MNPTSITATVQEFNGIRYYKSRGKPYFQRVIGRKESETLHRAVWTHHHGTPPADCHVHHRDENPANNAIENLELKPIAQHLADHMTPERRAWARQNIIAKAMPKAKAWHKSEAGRAWHAKHALATMEKRLAPRDFTCAECGAAFKAGCIQPAKYCSNRCRWRATGRAKRAKKRISRGPGKVTVERAG